MLPPFQTLLDDHGPAVHRFLVAYIGPTDADDCFQEACIAALRAYPKLRNAENLRAWLMRIAERKAIDAIRARGRRATPLAQAPEIAVSDPEVTGPLSDDPIWQRVRALPAKQRSAVFLRSAADFGYDEVASALDCSPDAARRNVHEGLKRLREELAA